MVDTGAPGTTTFWSQGSRANLGGIRVPPWQSNRGASFICAGVDGHARTRRGRGGWSAAHRTRNASGHRV